jgi:hypothetical protein
VNQVRAVQAAQDLAAGDQHRACWAAGQQEADLGGVVGVVQQDEQPALGGSQRPPARGRLLGLRGDSGGLYAQGPQQLPEGADGGAWWLPWGGAVEVDVQLPVGEPVGELVGGLDRQGGLADAAHAVDRADHHRPARRAGGVQQAAEPLQFPGAAGEPRDQARQLTRDRLGGRDRPAAPVGGGGEVLQRLVAGQDRPVEPLQVLRRFQPEVLDQPPAGGGEDLQRVGLTSAAVQCQHQLAREALPQRVRRRQGVQVADQFGVQSKLEFGVDPRLQRGQAQLLQAGCLDPAQRLGVGVAQRRPAPQPQRLAQPGRGLGRVAGAARLLGRLHQALEAVQVQAFWLDAE